MFSTQLHSIMQLKFRVIKVSGFRREAGENYAFPGYYAEGVVSIPCRLFGANYLSLLQGSKIQEGFLLLLRVLPETFVRNYHRTLRYDPQELISLLCNWI